MLKRHRKSSVSILRQRELFGNNNSYDVRSMQEREPLKALEYKPTLCSSQVLLGFSSLGNYVWGYKAQTNEADEACLVLECWQPDFTGQKRFSRITEVTMPYSIRGLGIYEELLSPLTLVDFEETVLGYMILQETDEERYIHYATLSFIDKQHPYAELSVGTAIHSNYVFGLTRHHLYMHEMETVFGVELRVKIIVMHVGPSAPPFKTCRWWKKDATSIRIGQMPTGVDPSVTCMILDAEGFLTELLPAQLNAKLVRYKDQSQLAEGTFCILDMSIALVRFVSTRSLEFVAVAEVRTPKEDFFTAFVAQLTCTGHRIVQSMKAASNGSSADVRCSKLRAVRQRGFEGGNCVLLNNDAVYFGSLGRLRNPVLPLEIKLSM